jgi:hypothetical protein
MPNNMPNDDPDTLALSGIPGYQFVGMYGGNQTFVDNWALRDGTVYRITFFFNQEVTDYSGFAVDDPLVTNLVSIMTSSFRIIE